MLINAQLCLSLPRRYRFLTSGRKENDFGEKLRIHIKKPGRINGLFGASAGCHSIRTTQIEKQENTRGHLNARRYAKSVRIYRKQCLS